jgi:hypothetical protein
MSFLLGVVASKWWVNHRWKRIRVGLPLSKRYLADALKRQFGGTVHRIKRYNRAGVTWQVTSTRSFKRIQEAALESQAGLPPEFILDLRRFTSAFARA